VSDKPIIVFNSQITISGIPLKAYEYDINGKSAIEWIMDRYQVGVDKDSGIINDPNQWSNDRRYVLDLIGRIARVSLETVQIVNALPAIPMRLFLVRGHRSTA
jgi:predicted helicase